jgi:hypothetical protein
LLHQAFAHCGKFLTAASRRSLGRVSVPVWLIILSNQLLIVALGGRYPHQLANQPQAPLLARSSLARYPLFTPQQYGVLASVSQCYPPPKGRFLRVTHPSATRLDKSNPYDLHVLSIPPAFILSQDQTLHGYLIIFFCLLNIPLFSNLSYLFFLSILYFFKQLP